jgi:DNA repair protein RadC
VLDSFQKYDFENIFTKVMLKNLSTQEEPLKNLVGRTKVQEKLLLQGRRALSEIELIALILNSSAKCKLSLDSAVKILNYCENNLQELARLSIEELLSIEGISISQAMSLSAAFELANRKNVPQDFKKCRIKSSGDAFRLFGSYFEDLDHEMFYVTYLNRANGVIRCEMLSKGGLTGTVVDIKLIMNRALLLKSSGILLAHNHPSGNLQPSIEDKEITHKIKEGCKLFDIQLIDHLILGNTEYFSFADEGIL